MPFRFGTGLAVLTPLGPGVYTLADTLDPRLQRSWHEAVAIVLQFGDSAAGLAVLPEAADVVITPEGTLELGFAAESGDPPVTSLARLLGALLQGVDAPEALRDLATGTTSESSELPSVDRFLQALSFFERPGRAQILRGLSERLAASVPEPATSRAVARLREKAASAPRSAAVSAPPRSPGAVLRALRRALLPAAVVLLLLAGVLAGAWKGWEAVVASRSRATPLDVVVGDAPGLAEAPARATTREMAAPVPVEAGAERGRAASRTAPAARAASIAAGTPLMPAARRTFLPDWLSNADTPGEFDWSANLHEPRIDMAGPVYSRAYPQVEPPTLVRRQLPTPRDSAGGHGYLELIVGIDGTVEHVRLIAAPGHFYGRMLVAAAKAWQFNPARLGGLPVRYRTRIPIAVAGGEPLPGQDAPRER